MKRLLCLLLTLIMMLTMSTSTMAAEKAEAGKSFLTLSTSLVTEQLNAVVSALGIKEEDLKNYDVESAIDYMKDKVATEKMDTPEEIEAVVKAGVKDLKANVSDQDIQKMVDTVTKVKKLGIDMDAVLDQASHIYEKYEDKIKDGTFKFDDVDAKDLGTEKIVTKSIGNFFTNVFDGAVGFVKSFLKK